MKTDYECAQIIDDSESDEEYIIMPKTKKLKTIKPKAPQPALKKCYNENDKVYEVGVDEVGRGPMFGRVYTAAVILPKDDSFDCSMVKDSKKFHSKKKIEEAAQYVKDHALAWYISFEDEKKIDEIILIDGNYFNPITYLDKSTNKIQSIPHVTVEGGDNKYASIAAASILAKVERDRYIDELCEQNPTLSEHYGIDSNKGYGAKRHMDGIKEHGITIWHRRSFGICKNYV